MYIGTYSLSGLVPKKRLVLLLCSYVFYALIFLEA